MSQESKKHEKVMKLAKFYEEFGREPKAKEEYEGVKIGAFLHNIRTKRIKINEEDLNYLNELRIRLTSKNIKKIVHAKVILLGEFYEKFTREPKEKETYKGVKIGIFLNSIRSEMISITVEDRNYLQNLGVRLIKENVQERVHKKVMLLGEFYNEVGREPKIREEYKGVKIGRFLGSIRSRIVNIEEEDRNYLQNLGVRLIKENVQERVHKKVMLLGEFYEEFAREPKMKEEYKGVKIGNFLGNIRSETVNIKEEDRNYLQNLGVGLIKENVQERVHKKVMLLGEFYEEFAREPKIREEYKGMKIGIFLLSIRSGHTKISNEEINFLENLGINITRITKKDKM